MNFDFILGATTKELEQFRAVCNQLLMLPPEEYIPKRGQAKSFSS